MKMINCQEATLLISEALDHPLSWTQQIELKFHLWVCKNCPGYARKIQWVHEIVKRWTPAPHIHLSAESKEKIKQALRQSLKQRNNQKNDP
ncbi:zf-HC2 domain-containing protein [Deltaproteobacteria bacterium TL4]